MKSVSVSSAKNNLSALLREVREGRSVTITDRGVVVARLVPPPPTRGVSPQAIDLAQRGLLVLPAKAPSMEWLRATWPRPKGKASAVRALLDDRESGR
ncbi:MAG TPA: type II toxin-antitoxin system prevent-host-death family antitoxin [Gemmatimonadaceae bacterium]|nr:type II toxin-antitoxin system prevent-host-death family antitoxin [Gemmatimonadaceae bacterium]